MNKIPLEIGRVVRSRAGRDRGRLLVIVGEVDDDFVLIADGALRKIGRPKKKRRKHLDARPQLFPGAKEALIENYTIREYLASESLKEG